MTGGDEMNGSTIFGALVVVLLLLILLALVGVI